MILGPEAAALATALLAGLLLLAGGLASVGRGQPAWLHAGLATAAAGVMTCAVLASTAQAGVAPPAAALWAAAAWAVAAGLAGGWAQPGRRWWALAASVGALFCAYIWVVVALPQAFRSIGGATAALLGTALLLATAGAVALHAPWPAGRWQRSGPAAGALLTAGLLVWGGQLAAGQAHPGPGGAADALAATAPPGLPALALQGADAALAAGWLAHAAPLAGPALGLLACLLVGCALLLAAARSGPRADPADRPPVRVPTRDITALDNLTQLPTRVYFESRLASVARACTAKNQRMAMFFIDLDGFKPVNDTFGHQYGDQVLVQVGKRLRQLSGRKGLAARVGGDEFLLLLSGAGDEAAIAQAAKRLIRVLSQPYSVEGREVVISCSVGIAVYPDNCSHTALITRADAAMYSAKRAGGSRHCFYTPELDDTARTNFELLADLRNAVSRNEFELHYQPKIDARTGQVTAAEALLRWRHPTRGMLLPGAFIEVAERFGLIGAIGDWVINDACRQAREWREKGLRMRVAINLSVHQMRQDDIADRIAQTLQQYRVHPSLLTCEITESAAMEDTRATQETFRRLGELGTHLSIDDFGTGYSSLAYLRKLPASELKIDRSMVMDIETSADARAIVNGVVQMAHALSLKVVAEGVENQRQQQVLVAMGCDELQGYLFARPMSARALLLWALGANGDAPRFKASLFGETRTAAPDERPSERRPVPSGQSAAFARPTGSVASAQKH